MRREHWPNLTLSALLCAASVACAGPSPVAQAMSLERRNQPDQAIAVLREDLRVHPDHLDSRRLLVRILAVTGDLGAARREADEIMRRTPDGDPTALIEIGHAEELAHHFDLALEAYDEAARRAPQSPLGPREGGLRAARWGEVELALPRLTEAVRRGADDTETLHALGLVRLHAGDLAGAEEAYVRCSSKDKEDTTCLLGLATLALKREDLRAALTAYDAVLARRRDHVGALLGRAYCLLSLGEKDAGLRALDRAAELGAPKENVTKLRGLASR